MPAQPTARGLTLVVLVAFALYLCWRIIVPFLDVLLWAAVLAVVFYPVHRRLGERVRGQNLAAAMSTLLVIITIIVPVSFITLAVVQELRNAAANLDTSNPLRFLDPEAPVIGPAIRWAGQYVDLAQFRSPDFLKSHLEALTGTLAAGTLGLVGGAAAVVVKMFLVIFTLFYLFRDGAEIRHAGSDLLPLERAQASDIVTRTREVIAASVYGVVVIAAIQGTLGGLIFWVLGLPSPLLWGVVMFFMAMIPMAGTPLVWGPAVVYLAATGAWGKAAFLLGWGVLVVGSIDNFLSPRLVGRRTRMHELLIFFSVLGGIDVFGVLGLVLGPVVVAVTLALIEVARQANRPTIATVAPRADLDE